MNTCIARCANRSRVHTLSSHSRKLHLLPPLWDPFLLSLRLPFTPPRAFCRLDSLADSSLHLRHLSHGGGDEKWDCRALFIQLPYLNVALTRRKIICKNPHKICKPPPPNAPGNCRVMSSWDYYVSLPPSPDIDHPRRAGKKGTRFTGPADEISRVSSRLVFAAPLRCECVPIRGERIVRKDTPFRFFQEIKSFSQSAVVVEKLHRCRRNVFFATNLSKVTKETGQTGQRVNLAWDTTRQW